MILETMQKFFLSEVFLETLEIDLFSLLVEKSEGGRIGEGLNGDTGQMSGELG